MKEILTKFRDEMHIFSSKSPVESPIVVSYDKNTHLLTYRHLSNNISPIYMRKFYYAKKKFRLGILTANKYNKLMKELNKLLEDPDLDKDFGLISFSVNELCLKVLKTYNNSVLVGPQDFIDIKFVSMTNPIIIWILMRFYSIETRILYKLAKNEIKQKKKNKGKSKEIIKEISKEISEEIKENKKH